MGKINDMVKDVHAVYMFEGWLLDILAKKMEQEVKNLFPSQADLPTLLAYERMRQKAEDTTKMFFVSSTIFGMSLNRYNRMYALVNTRLISIISFMFMNLKRE